MLSKKELNFKAKNQTHKNQEKWEEDEEKEEAEEEEGEIRINEEMIVDENAAQDDEIIKIGRAYHRKLPKGRKNRPDARKRRNFLTKPRLTNKIV